jgi:xanthine dehydrogenase accessory factor
VREVLGDLERWVEAGRPTALVTLVSVEGSAPRQPGARLAVTDSGLMSGSVSGGCVESDLLERGRRVLETGRPESATYPLSTEEEMAVGLGCGSIDVFIEAYRLCAASRAVAAAVTAERRAVLATVLDGEDAGRKLAIVDGQRSGSLSKVLDRELAGEAEGLNPEGECRLLDKGQGRVLLELFAPRPLLVVVGATHVAVHLCRMATEAGLRVVVIEPRAAFARDQRLVADEVIEKWPADALASVELGDNSSLVTLTHDAKFDIPALTTAIRARIPYVGAIGSRVTHERRKLRLAEEGLSAGQIAGVRSPVGLDIGSRDPAGIAISILSEILATRHGRSGGSLRDRRPGH